MPQVFEQSLFLLNGFQFPFSFRQTMYTLYSTNRKKEKVEERKLWKGKELRDEWGVGRDSRPV